MESPLVIAPDEENIANLQRAAFRERIHVMLSGKNLNLSERSFELLYLLHYSPEKLSDHELLLAYSLRNRIKRFILPFGFSPHSKNPPRPILDPFILTPVYQKLRLKIVALILTFALYSKRTAFS